MKIKKKEGIYDSGVRFLNEIGFKFNNKLYQKYRNDFNSIRRYIHHFLLRIRQ